MKAADFCMNEMEREFPLGTFRDVEKGVSGAEIAVHPESKSLEVKSAPLVKGCAELFDDGESTPEAVDDPSVPEKRFKFAGYGGQGVLSLGLCIAEAARLERRHTLWFPSYGPEQRGGRANCSVVVSGTSIGAPTVEQPDVLVCMNQPAYERFAADVKKGGAIILDETVPVNMPPPDGVTLYRWPAIRMAEEFGVPKAANTMMLAALRKYRLTGLSDDSLENALVASFKKKPELGEKNRELLRKAEFATSSSSLANPSESAGHGLTAGN